MRIKHRYIQVIDLTEQGAQEHRLPHECYVSFDNVVEVESIYTVQEAVIGLLAGECYTRCRYNLQFIVSTLH